MATPTNILQQVQTYQRASLGLLQNLNCFIGKIANTKFKEFDKIQANLGSSVTFDSPPRFTSADGLVVTWQPSAQNVHTLTVSQSKNTSFAFTAQERIFNVEKDTESYMRVFGESATAELATAVEIDVAKQANSSVINQVTGALQTDSGPFRCFGDGTTAINSYQQLAQAITNFKNFGAVHKGIKVILPDTIVPSIVGTGLNQFSPRRNDQIANSWEIGEFGTPPVEYFVSNLLPIQNAGTVGTSAQTLTVVSTNDPTGANISQITLSGATNNDANAIKAGDILYFVDGVSGQPNMRYLTYIGHGVSAQQVQVRATANAAANGSGQVTVSIYPSLTSQPVAGSASLLNINNNIVAGMQMQALNSHRCGLIVGGDAMYLAMPRLPDQSPFYTANEMDPETRVSMRMTYGATLGQNQQGTIYDCVWGSMCVPIYSMRIAFPLPA